jgi:hypothetical protein
LTSCVPDGTPAPVGFYPTEALSLTGQKTDNAIETAKRKTPKALKRRSHSNSEAKNAEGIETA